MTMDWTGKKVFITGGAGFIGSHLVKRLKQDGAHVYHFIHKTQPEMPTRDSFIGDLASNSQLELNRLKEYLQNLKPEIIFHLAAQPLVSVAQKNELDTLKANVAGTYNLLHSCKGLQSLKSFVHISTDKVFGNIPTIKQDSILDGITHPYNASKAAGDVIAQMYANFFDIPMVVVRHANVYGAGDRHFDRVIPRTIQKILRGESPIIRGDGSNTRDYIHVNDVVDLYTRAANLPYNFKLSTLNIGGFHHSVSELIHVILGKMNRIDLSPKFEKQWKGEIPHQHIETPERWKPKITLEEGLDLTIPWYVEKYG